MILFIVSFFLCALAITGFIYHFINFKRDRLLIHFTKVVKREFMACLLLFTAACLMCGYGIVSMNKLKIDNSHNFFLVFGCLVFGLSFFTLFETFTIYYYKPEFNPKRRSLIKKIMFVMIPIAIIAFFISTEGYAKYLTFPLVCGVNFSNKGVKFFTAANKPSGGFSIAWYGIIMLVGALIAYFVCDHHFYKEYKKHGIIDTMFILVFLIGILGARIWYCFVLDRSAHFWDFQSGGLAIMGGALFGAISGIIFMLIFRRYINIRHAMDMILPCVLIAQAIGRWGNFFNHEVYGYTKLVISETWFLPTIIKNQMAVSYGGDSMYLPLFLIEFCTNLIGYFVITYGLDKIFKKRLSLGDKFFSYLIWYGLTRIILEPLRAGTYEYDASIVAAWVMFGCGIGAIILIHLYDYFVWGKRTFKIELMQNETPKFHVFHMSEKRDNKFLNLLVTIFNKTKQIFNKFNLYRFYTIDKNPYKKLFKNEAIKN